MFFSILIFSFFFFCFCVRPLKLAEGVSLASHGFCLAMEDLPLSYLEKIFSLNNNLPEWMAKYLQYIQQAYLPYRRILQILLKK